MNLRKISIGLFLLLLTFTSIGVTVTNCASAPKIKIAHFSTPTIVLTSSNLVNLRGVIDKQNVDSTLAALKLAAKEAKGSEIYLVIESRGGYIVDGMRFIEQARRIPNLHTITIFAASMASAIAQALPGTRYIVPDGVMMFHRASNIKYMDEWWDSEQTNAKRIGLSVDAYRMKVLREWWVRGPANIKEHVADFVTDIVCDKSLAMTYDVIKYEGSEFFPSRSIELARCPLVVQPLK